MAAYQLKKSSTTPVHIVEDHHSVLPIIHRAIAQKLLPFCNISMLHFDSHPDLLEPDVELAESDFFCKDKLYNSLDIATWITPLIYEGHIGAIVWVKPPWSHQIEESAEWRELAVGYDKVSKKLKYVENLN